MPIHVVIYDDDDDHDEIKCCFCCCCLDDDATAGNWEGPPCFPADTTYVTGSMLLGFVDTITPSKVIQSNK